MHHEIAPAVAADMHDVALDGDAAEAHAAIVAHRLVVIARHEHEIGALAHLAKQLLEHVVMGLRPIDAAPDAPEIDDVADEIKASASWQRRKSREASAWQALVPRCRSEMNGADSASSPLHGANRLRPAFQHDGPRSKLVLLQPCDSK
jgi:hypothetical protein